MTIRPHSIHHINFPCTDVERTKAFYQEVFGMKAIDVSRVSGTPILLMTFGNFDLHFTPHDPMPDLDPTHFCVEVDDWDHALARLDELGIEITGIIERPQNRSIAGYIRDPDNNIIELMHHPNWDHSIEPTGRARATYTTKV